MPILGWNICERFCQCMSLCWSNKGTRDMLDAKFNRAVQTVKLVCFWALFLIMLSNACGLCRYDKEQSGILPLML